MSQTRSLAFLRRAPARYLWALLAVAAVFSLRWWLLPWSGTVAPFALFFVVVLVICLFAGIGPGLFAVLLSAPLATYLFVARAGYPLAEATLPSALYLGEGLVVVYLIHL